MNFLELDKRLKTEAPSPQAPSRLHASIMRAIEREDSPEPARNYSPLVKRLTFATCAIVIAAVTWSITHRPSPQPQASLVAATEALEVGDQLKESIPQIQLVSLSDELDHLNQDLGNATQTLLATLP